MIEIDSLESQIAYLEDQVRALKTSQPFYNGQFSPVLYATPNVYDQEITLTAGQSAINSFIRFKVATQDFPLDNIYFKYMDTSNNELPAYSWRQLQRSMYSPVETSTSLYFFTQHFPTVPGAQTVRIKYYVVSSDVISVTYVPSWSTA